MWQKFWTAKLVANILGYRYIDSGAMYRAVTLYFLEHHIAPTNPKEVSRALQQINFVQGQFQGDVDTYLNGLNVERYAPCEYPKWLAR